jgi:hypothetical protein
MFYYDISVVIIFIATSLTYFLVFILGFIFSSLSYTLKDGVIAEPDSGILNYVFPKSADEKMPNITYMTRLRAKTERRMQEQKSA